jgi:serine/threonine protein kinase
MFTQIKTGEKFAVKVINKSVTVGKEELVRNEIAILKKISRGHPNLLTLEDFFESKNNC